MALIQENSLFTNASQLSPDQQRALGRTLIVAPHQDDESLGCGGTIYLLNQLKVPIHVVFVSDGSMSHPNSKKYPTDKLISLREKESIEALGILGVSPEHITFLQLKDGQLPTPQAFNFDLAVHAMGGVLYKFKPETIFLPWQRDPHPDHRATWQIVDRAIMNTGTPIRRLAYFVWLWERAGADDLPTADDGKIWQVDIEKGRECKKRAISAYLSQTTALIDDDPEGFILSAEVQAHFDTNVEFFLKMKS